MAITPIVISQLFLYLVLSLILRFTPRISHCFAKLLTIFMVSAGAIIAGYFFIETMLHGRLFEQSLFSWFHFGSIEAYWGIYIDKLTATMLVAITTVSAVVHIYSFGYMAEDKKLIEFISYLSLFTFFMIVLVVAKNFLQLFVGWEGVGLCSYLLIGFWYKKESATTAANKAFIVNRIGDLALIIGISALIFFTKTISFEEIFAQKEQLSVLKIHIYGTEFLAIDFIALMLLLGAMGKSAQIGLHVWLPDAMEGPTPVSALIHAATMVTAGVFLIARCAPLFECSIAIKSLTMVVGGVTCFFAAYTAIGQNDIKKIIAYSTCSQLGYMFLACGVGAYGAAIFHLFTHAFFKALLFLCAGNIIHAAHHEQDIRKISIKPSAMPFTYFMLIIGSLALSGIFPLAGYYSKDLILESVYLSPAVLSRSMFILGIAVAFLTAIYSMKIIVQVFATKKDSAYGSDAHEAYAIMNVPLLILLVGSAVAGVIGSYYLKLPELIWPHDMTHTHLTSAVEYAPLVTAVAGIILGYLIYKLQLNTKIAKAGAVFYQLSLNKFYFDEIYHSLVVRPFIALSTATTYFDTQIDKYGPGGVVAASRNLCKLVRFMQTGFIFDYALAMIVGILIALGWLVNLFYHY